MFEYLTNQDIKRLLEDAKAIIAGSHVVYTSDKHGTAYVNKDALYRHTLVTADLCYTLADRVKEALIGAHMPPIPEAVVAPAVGGVVLSQWTAFHLSRLTQTSFADIPALYAERVEETLIAPDRKIVIGAGSSDEGDESGLSAVSNAGRIIRALNKGESLVIKREQFTLKRGQAASVAGKTVLVVEDVLNTGGSAARTVEAVRSAGGDVVAVAALCNRGGVTAADLDVPLLVSLLDVTMDAWDEPECPMCKSGVPVNTDVGHGKQYLARKGS